MIVTQTIRIAVILTFHNRKNKTVNCIRKVYSQRGLAGNISIEIIACDDGSTDGTTNSILDEFKEVKIVYGDGSLFWARGMGLALEVAQKSNPDFYLMVNDDVDFFDDMFETMLDTYVELKSEGSEGGVVGCTCGTELNVHTYGGIKWSKNGFKIISQTVYPTDSDRSCNIANWNCFLLPAEVMKNVGNIDVYYEHGLADYDYSLRMVEMGYAIYSTKKDIGKCDRNSIKNTWQDKSLPLLTRLKLMQKRTAKPWRSDFYFFKKHFGFFGLYWFLRQYLSMLNSSNL